MASRQECSREFRQTRFGIYPAPPGDVRCVRVPLYTCRTVVETMERLGIPVITYRIDERLEPEELPELEKGNTFLYTNYFGIKEECVDRLASRYGGSPDCGQCAGPVFSGPFRVALPVQSAQVFRSS